MVALAAPRLALADTLCCLGLGFLLAALYDLARILLGGAKPVCFVLDLAAFALAGLLLGGFAACRSYSGVVRWYMAAGLCGGLAGYFWGIAPATRAADRRIKWLLTRPFALAWLLALRPLAGLLGRFAQSICANFVKKKGARRKLKRTKQLQNQGRVLYNS